MSLPAILADQLADPAVLRAALAELLRRGMDPRETQLLTPWVPVEDEHREHVHVTRDALRGVTVAEAWYHPDEHGRWHAVVEGPDGEERYATSGDTQAEVQEATAAWLLEQGWHPLPQITPNDRSG